MANAYTISKQFNLGGKAFAESRTLSGGEALVREVSIAAAVGGTVAAAMTSTTSTTTTQPPGGSQSGTLLLTSVAGLAIGNRLDVYWSGGSLYGATIEDIAGSSIFFTGGTLWAPGSAFPGNGTAVQVMVPTSLPFVFTGNQLQAIALYGDQGGTFILDTATPSNAYPTVLPTPATVEHWETGGSRANPVAGVSVSQLFVSHGSTAGSAVMRVGALINP